MNRKSSPATIRDVARKAGVSAATVSRYINNTVPVSKAVARRVQQVMDELNYVPHAAARQLATQKAHAIGLLLTTFYMDFFAPLVGGIESVAQEAGLDLLVAARQTANQANKSIPIGPHNADGLIVFVGTLDDDEILELYRAGFPMILIYHSPPEGAHIPSVSVSNESAARGIVDHLIEVHDRRRIIFLRGPASQEDSMWREKGYQESLTAHGIEVDPALILSGDYTRTRAYQAMSEFLENGHRDFDAIFTGNDDAAVGVLNALSEKGLRVPEDISVAGFDDMQISAFMTPPLTTVRAPTAGVGQTAAQHLLKVLAGQDVPSVTLLPTDIVIRHSCGCQPA